MTFQANGVVASTQLAESDFDWGRWALFAGSVLSAVVSVFQAIHFAMRLDLR